MARVLAWSLGVVLWGIVYLVASSFAQEVSTDGSGSDPAIRAKKVLGIKISPMNPTNFTTGFNASLTCSLASPTLVRFEWLFNNEPLNTVYKRVSISTSQGPGESGGLTFKSHLDLLDIGRIHIGEYTCKATHPEKGEQNVSTFVDVHPDKFKSLDEDCHYDDQCVSPTMVCYLGKCACHHSFPVKMQRGAYENCFQASRLDNFCYVDEQCQYNAPNIKCVNNFCRCEEGFFRIYSDELGRGICIAPAKFNETCQADEQCKQYHTGLTCVDEKCVCVDPDAVFIDSRRKCAVIQPIGSPCFYNEHCDDGRGGRKCNDKKCTCIEDFVESENGICIFDSMSSQRKKKHEVFVVSVAIGVLLAFAGSLILLVWIVKCFRDGCGRTRTLKNPRNRRSKKTGEVILVGAESSP